MDSMRILIAALSAACLLVASLIVVVLRRPAPRKKRRPHVDEQEAQTLARIYAVQPASNPAPSRPALGEPELPELLAAPFTMSDPVSYGRIPGMPASPPRMDPPGVDRRAGPLPAARIPEAPLPFERVSAQAGWGYGGQLPNQRPISGGLPMPPSATGGAAFAVPPASRPGFLPGIDGSGNPGQVPDFASADLTPASGLGAATSGRLVSAPEQRRVGALTRVYAEGIQVQYDPDCDAVDTIFADCPMRSGEEAALAFRVLLAKVRTVLKPLGRDRAALLVDVAGLERGAAGAVVWNEPLKAFLLAACEQVGPGRLLIARYDSRTGARSRQEALARIQGATAAQVWGLQGTVYGSREEAAELLARLREPTAIAGS